MGRTVRKRNIELKAAVGFAVLALLGAACAELFAPAAAVVRGEKITIAEVKAALADFEETDQFRELAAQGRPQAIRRQFEQSHLSTLVRRKVLAPEAERLGVAVADADVAGRMEEIRADFESEEQFREALAGQGLTLEHLEELVRDRVLEEQLREAATGDVGPTEDEVRAYYEENEDEFRQTRAQHILVDDEELAEDLADRLQTAPAGRLDELFERLAARHSEDPGTADEGGDLGYFSPDQFVEEFEQAVAELDAGEVSDVVETEFGFHVIRVLDRRVQPFEEARDEIAQRLAGEARDEAWQQWLQETYEEADVRINPRFGEFDVAAQQIVDPGPEHVPGAEEGELVPAPGEAGN
jgi:parvulin-like peptidyl-prolyl isomerase